MRHENTNYTTTVVIERLGALANELRELRRRASRGRVNIPRVKLLGDLVDREQKILRQLGDIVVKQETANALERAEERLRDLDNRRDVRRSDAFEALEKH